MVGVERYMSKLKFTQEELKGDDWDKQYYKVKAYLDSIRRITYASPVEASKSGEHIHSLETMLDQITNTLAEFFLELVAGGIDIDWRPKEVMPEDYYAF